MRRPPAYYPEWRLDRVLKRKAEQGVKVYVIVYKEVRMSWYSINSEITYDVVGHSNNEHELPSHKSAGTPIICCESALTSVTAYR